MLQIIKCVECWNEISLLDQVAVDVVLTTASWCQHCAHCKSEKREFHFCCQGCFHKYMKKVLDGKAELEWK